MMTAPPDAQHEILRLVQTRAVPKQRGQLLLYLAPWFTADQWLAVMYELHMYPPRWKDGAWAVPPTSAHATTGAAD